MKIRRWTAISLAAAAVWISGCGGPGKRLAPERALPFCVRVNPVDLSRQDPRLLQRAMIPALFRDPAELTHRLAEALDESGVFTLVLREDEDMPADLEIRIAIENEDYGPGRLQLPGAFFSTLVWLFAGHASWWIPNRAYPDSGVVLRLAIQDASRAGARKPGDEDVPIFQNILPLNNLLLSFAERTGLQGWFINILIPPWWGDGEPEVAGTSLANRSIEFFGETEPAQILSSFPASYFVRRGRFLNYDPEAGEILVVSRSALDRIRIDLGPAMAPRIIEEEELSLLEVEESEKDAVWTRIAGRVAGLGIGPLDRYYRLPIGRLIPGGESLEGHVQIEADLEGVGPPAHWTVYLEPRTKPPGALAAR